MMVSKNRIVSIGLKKLSHSRLLSPTFPVFKPKASNMLNYEIFLRSTNDITPRIFKEINLRFLFEG